MPDSRKSITGLNSWWEEQAMKKAKKQRCCICHKWYEPDSRARKQQKSCDNKACRKEQKSRANKSWLTRHPEYGCSRKLKTRDWAKQYPNYWQEYRSDHPEYRAKDNKRRCLSRKQAKNAAKQDEIREFSVEKLKSIQCFEPENAAKQDGIDRRVDSLIEYLLWKECAAKQDDMVIIPTNGS